MSQTVTNGVAVGRLAPGVHHNTKSRIDQRFEQTFPDGSSICWIAQKLANPNKANEPHWQCICDGCSTQVAVISSKDLTRNRLPRCPKCNPPLRTIEQIEAAHPGYVCGPRSGHDRHMTRRWIELEWLVVASEADAPRLDVPGFDGWAVTDEVKAKQSTEKTDGPGSIILIANFFTSCVVGNSRPLKFFPAKALDACVRRARSAASTATVQSRYPEAIERYGELLVRESYVRRVLGMKEATFYRWKTIWSKEGERWPILNPERTKPRTFQINGKTYYLKQHVDEMENNLENLPTSIPDDHPTLYSFERTCSLTGLSDWNSKPTRTRHNLSTEPFWVRFQMKLKGKTVWVLRCELGFTRKSVDDLVDLLKLNKLPKGTTPWKDMWRKLREASKKCNLDQNALYRWCTEGLLDAKRTDYVTSRGLRQGWIVADESYLALRDLLRKVGWDTAAAEVELRELNLASEGRVEQRIKDQKEEAEQEIKARKKADGKSKLASDGTSDKVNDATDVPELFRKPHLFALNSLKGNERKVVVFLCTNGGKCGLGILAKHLGWPVPFDNAFNQTRIRLNRKLKRISFILQRGDNAALLSDIS